MYGSKDLNHALQIETYKAKMSIAEKAVHEIDKALGNIKEPDENTILRIAEAREALEDLEVFLMGK
jgi:hypothetical protein